MTKEKYFETFFEEYKTFFEDIVQYICGARYVKSGNKYVRKQVESDAIIAGRGLFHNFKEYANGNEEIAERYVRDTVKEALGRIVFIHFLSYKGWMGVQINEKYGTGDKHFLMNLYKSYQGNDFYGDVLFNILNSLSICNYVDSDGVKSYKYEIDNIIYKFPYLNSDLIIKNQCNNFVNIPNYFFVSCSNSARKFLGIPATATPYPYSASEGLFEFFERYNFTIDENWSDEAVVGIDPEMLGKIFENLLEDNKDKGAFYTPKPVVEYMCQQSLIAYLQNGVLKGVQSGVLNGVVKGVQNLSVVSTDSQHGLQNEAKTGVQNGIPQTTKQAANEPSTNNPSDELQKANLAFIKNSLTEDEIKSQIEHFVKTKSLDIEPSVESRQGLGEVGIESGSESAPEKDNESAESASENGSESKKPQMSIAMVSVLNRLLKDVKICDPAIGSGAFPMGLLNELLECREVLALRLIDEGGEDEVFADK